MQELNSLDEIEAGDKITILDEDGETVVDAVEVSEVEVGGLAGEKIIKTDEELDIPASSLDVLLTDCLDDTDFYTAYLVEEESGRVNIGGQTVSEGDTVEQDGETWTVDDIEKAERKGVEGTTIETTITATRKSDGKTVTHPVGTLESAFERGDCTVIPN